MKGFNLQKKNHEQLFSQTTEVQYLKNTALARVMYSNAAAPIYLNVQDQGDN